MKHLHLTVTKITSNILKMPNFLNLFQIDLVAFLFHEFVFSEPNY